MLYLWLKQELNKTGQEKLYNNLFGNNAKETIKEIIKK